VTVREPFASRLLFPLVERRFTYAEYARFLDRLSERLVVPMREFAQGEGDLALRHDVDSRLGSALELARREAERGLPATYFVLHTAPYWSDPELLARLRQLQELGHEVGLHHDLVTLEKLRGVDTGERLRTDLDRLRSSGIEIRGAAAHGSPWCHLLGYHNNYVFAGWDEPVQGFPNHEVTQKLRPADFGLEYEAYHLGEDAYFSDARFEGGHRWHPDGLFLQAGQRAIVLVHPCHWDSSVGAKVIRLGRRLVARRPQPR
jgi:hypothetical protein